MWKERFLNNDDVIKWKHFPRYWPFVRGIHRSPVNSPHKGQWRGALMFSLICIWINDWVNNGEAGNLRRYRAHYDVTVMEKHIPYFWTWRKWYLNEQGDTHTLEGKREKSRPARWWTYSKYEQEDSHMRKIMHALQTWKEGYLNEKYDAHILIWKKDRNLNEKVVQVFKMGKVGYLDGKGNTFILSIIWMIFEQWGRWYAHVVWQNTINTIENEWWCLKRRFCNQKAPDCPQLKVGQHVTPRVPNVRQCVSWWSGPTFIKPDQLDSWIKDQIKITLLSAISSLQLRNFVSCGRDKPPHMTQHFVTVGAKLWTAEHFLIDPWSMDQADLV